MRFGCCVPFSGTDEDLARVELLAEMGYQFIEPPVASLCVEKDPEEWYAVRRAFNRSALIPEVFNCLLPQDLKIVGDQVDWPRLEKFIAQALDRAEEAGAQVIVFGSGRSREMPENYPAEDALSQVRYFLSMAADYAGEMKIAIEPLCQRECNLINIVEQAALVAREVGRIEVGILADTYHMDAEEEPWSNAVDNIDLLSHIHICDRDRRPPGKGDADLVGFFTQIQAAGYSRRMSIECHLEDWDTAPREALEKMREWVT